MIKIPNMKDRLCELISQNISYEEIGRMFECSGSYIKQLCKKFNIPTKRKRKINSKEHFNKGRRKTGLIYCANCGKTLSNRQHKFCSSKCSGEYLHNSRVAKWLTQDDQIQINHKNTPPFIKRYLIETRGCSCEKCGWSEINEYMGNIPIEVHHIDGDYLNNELDNLILLCPNCHSLTPTYKNHNKVGRTKRKNTPIV